VSIGFSMVFTTGEDEQPTISEAVSMNLGSVTAVTTPVVDSLRTNHSFPSLLPYTRAISRKALKTSWKNGSHFHLRGQAGLSLWILHIPTG
jgi:hypothetical protein